MLLRARAQRPSFMMTSHSIFEGFRDFFVAVARVRGIDVGGWHRGRRATAPSFRFLRCGRAGAQAHVVGCCGGDARRRRQRLEELWEASLPLGYEPRRARGAQGVEMGALRPKDGFSGTSSNCARAGAAQSLPAHPSSRSCWPLGRSTESSGVSAVLERGGTTSKNREKRKRGDDASREALVSYSTLLDWRPELDGT